LHDELTQSDRVRPDRRGIVFAVTAAVLFGASTPAAKVLLADISPVMLAGLLYLGCGVSLGLWLIFRRGDARRQAEARLARPDLPWLSAVVLFGGILGPVLLMWGLDHSPASTSSLLLNLEGVLTALLAWFVFREHFDRRIALGMGAIVAGGVLLSWKGTPEIGLPVGSLAVSAACLCWAIDNNLTRKISAADPVQITAIKGLVAGSVNVLLALGAGESLPPLTHAILAGALGLASYGVSIVLFILALRHLGSARTGAYFSAAPFVGAMISIGLLREPLTIAFAGAAALMLVGLWLHVTEKHCHEHDHAYIEHDHWHEHDEHHQHDHPPGIDPEGPHSHPHIHHPLRHTHAHYPDLHHQHRH